jgi:hypothetical protein
MKTERNRRILRKLFWGAGAIATVAILSWVVLDVAAGMKLRRAISQWQEAGFHMDVWALLPPPAPAEKNAAVILGRVVQMRLPENHDQRLTDRPLQEANRRVQELTTRILKNLEDQAIPTTELQELDQLLKLLPIAYRLETAKEAVEYELFDAYLQWDSGMDLIAPHVHGIRILGRYLQTEAVLRAAEGDWAQAYSSLITVLQMGNLIQSEPLIISFLTGQALNTTALETLELFFRIQPPDTEMGEQLQKALSSAGTGQLNKAVVVDATALAGWLYARLQAGNFAPSTVMGTGYGHFLEEYSKWLDKGIFRPMHKADFATYLNSTRERLVLIQNAYSHVALDPKLDELTHRQSEETPWYAIVTAHIIPALGRIHLLEAMSEVRLDLATVALAANAYRSHSGDWPQGLEDLVPQYLSEIPQDPFGGGFIRYLRQDERVILYSVGPDQTDDGGKPLPAQRTEPGDIVWILARTQSTDAATPVVD